MQRMSSKEDGDRKMKQTHNFCCRRCGENRFNYIPKLNYCLFCLDDIQTEQNIKECEKIRLENLNIDKKQNKLTAFTIFNLAGDIFLPIILIGIIGYYNLDATRNYMLGTLIIILFIKFGVEYNSYLRN
jgi:hypothetical protein